MENESTLEAALPGYEVGQEIGRGAFGVVMAARHRQLGREVAIKLLSPDLVSSDAVRERFHVEAQVLASIDHPHVVPVYDYVEYQDACILVMERLGGGTVWHRFVAQGYDQRTACAIALVVCSGLHGAHRHGVLHRDMKPENVLISDDGTMKVGDFGIARVLGEDDTLATRSGELLGTPAYMAPEQAKGAELGAATDVYATGVMLYELLSGKLPFSEEGGSLAIVLRHVNEDPVPLGEAAPITPSGISDAVMHALERSPEDRYQSAEDFGAAIGEAASSAWGAGWLAASGIALREPGVILTAAQRGPMRGASSESDGDVVRPLIELHSGGGPPTGVALSELLPLRSTPIEMPKRPKVLTAAAVAFAAVALILALVGVGSPSTAPSQPRGTLMIAGVDPTAGIVPLNLDRPISVVLRRPIVGLGSPVSAAIVLRIAGVQVLRSTTVQLAEDKGVLEATVDASAGRYIIGGKVAAELELSGAHSLSDAFSARIRRTPFATFGGIVGIILLLVVIAYTESLMRTLRLGRRRDKRGAVAGLVVVGALGGVTATAWAWILEFSRPGLVGVIVTAAVGAAAGLSAGLAGLRIGERARVHRRSNRLVLVAKRAPIPPSSPSPVGVG